MSLQTQSLNTEFSKLDASKLDAAFATFSHAEKTWGDATSHLLRAGIECGNQMLSFEKDAKQVRGNWTAFVEERAAKHGISTLRLWQLIKLAKIAKADPEALRNAHTITQAMRLAGIIPECGAPTIKDVSPFPVLLTRTLSRFESFFSRDFSEVPAIQRHETAGKLRELADRIDAATTLSLPTR